MKSQTFIAILSLVATNPLFSNEKIPELLGVQALNSEAIINKEYGDDVIVIPEKYFEELKQSNNIDKISFIEYELTFKPDEYASYGIFYDDKSESKEITDEITIIDEQCKGNKNGRTRIVHDSTDKNNSCNIKIPLSKDFIFKKSSNDVVSLYLPIRVQSYSKKFSKSYILKIVPRVYSSEYRVSENSNEANVSITFKSNVDLSVKINNKKEQHMPFRANKPEGVVGATNDTFTYALKKKGEGDYIAIKVSPKYKQKFDTKFLVHEHKSKSLITSSTSVVYNKVLNVLNDKVGKKTKVSSADIAKNIEITTKNSYLVDDFVTLGLTAISENDKLKVELPKKYTLDRLAKKIKPTLVANGYKSVKPIDLLRSSGIRNPTTIMPKTLITIPLIKQDLSSTDKQI